MRFPCRTWHICSLVDGTINGPGYGYEIKNKPDDELGHKLLINCKYRH